MVTIKEIWKPVEGYGDRYEVSNLGNVRVVGTGILRTPFKLSNGYLSITLKWCGKDKKALVHRLVAIAFKPNIFMACEVNHINKDRCDNRADNLEWVTRQFNIEYSHAGDYVVTSPCGEVYHISNLNKFCREHGLVSTHMHGVANGKRKQHNGWTVIKS